MALRPVRFSSLRGIVAASLVWVSLVSVASLLASSAIRAQSPDADAGKDTSKDSKPAPAGMVKLRIEVVNPHGTPVTNASVYVRFNEAGGTFHHDKLAEMNFKTNQDGSVKVPPVPQGKIQIQVIATGWHTFGQWFDINQDAQTVTVKLEEPPHWY
jgi:hypothetical protein